MITKYLPLTNVPLIPTPLHRSTSSPYCYAASLSPSIDGTLPSLPPNTNFLATQVWPSSRTASHVIEKHVKPEWTVCELGCGPGLPSITAASCQCNVIATDVDAMALEMVRLAAKEQCLHVRLDTQIFDLTSRENELPMADLYILSDVFESDKVAEGAAWHVGRLLQQPSQSRVWVFAQSDRAQRQVFLTSLQRVDGYGDLEWTTNQEPDVDARMWLFDLNEMDVRYNQRFKTMQYVNIGNTKESIMKFSATLLKLID